MFEKYLENILKKQLGAYINGFDSSNLSLGVWSGDLIIENVSIKPEALQMLEIPVKLIHSYVGKLQIKVPWSSLSSKPIEIILDKVYLVLNPIKKEEWNFFDYKSLDKKKELLQTYAENFIKKMQNIQKGETQQEDAGYVQRLTMKIVDNLQITIKSINIRFENIQQITKNPFALGISLNQLDVVTTNQDWKPQFIDRTNQDIPMRKLLKLNNLDIYWIYEDAQILSDGKLENINEQLEKQIQIQQEKVISISADMKLIQTNPGTFKEPEFQVFINLDQINLLLHKLQMQQVIQLIEFINKFQLKLQKTKNENKKISDDALIKYEQNFKELYQQIYDSTDLKLQKQSDIDIYNNILISVDIDTITTWCQPILKNYCQKLSIQNMKKEKKGWFSGWYGEQDDSADVEKIQNFFKDLTSDNLNVQVSKRPFDYIWFSLDFSLQGGCIQVSQKKDNVLESVKVSYNNLNAKVNQRETNTEVIVSLGRLLIDLIDKDKAVINSINFLNNKDIENLNFITVKYQKNPLKIQENDVQLDQMINVDLLPCNIIYNHNMIERLSQIFKLESDEQIKQQAWDKIDQKLDEQQLKLQKAMEVPRLMKIQINLSSPVLYLPFTATESWRLNLGKFTIKTNEKCLDAQNCKYDIYDTFLQQIQMDYLLNDVCAYTVIDDFQIKFKIEMIRPNYKGQGCDMNVKGLLSKFNINLTQQIYRKLLKMSDIFIQQKNTQNLEVITRKTLIPKAKKIGEMYIKQGNNELDWNKYQVVATNTGYFYFFSGSKQNNPEFYYYIRQSVCQEQDQNTVLSVISLKNRYTDILLGFDKHDVALQWIKFIDSMNPQQKQTVQQQVKDPLQETLIADFQILNMGLNLETQEKKQICYFQTSFLQFKMNQKAYDQNIQISLGQLSLEDSVRKYLKPEFNYFITCDKSQKQLVSLDILMIDQKSPNYKNIEMQIDAQFGSLFINFKCETIMEILNFIKPEQIQRQESFKNVKVLPNLENLNKSKSSLGSRNSRGSLMINHLQQSHIQSIVKKVDDQIKTKLNLHLQQIQLTCINRLTFLPQGQIVIQNSKIQYIQKQFQNDINIELGNLKIEDCTNYPNSLIREDQYKQYKKREIFGVANDGENILTVNVKQYHPKIMVDDVGMSCEVTINKVKIDFMMQPLMRFLDVVLVQMMLSFGDVTDPYKITLEDAQKTLDNLSFMNLTVNIKDSILMIKSSELCKEYLQLSFGLIEITNQIDQSYDRVIKKDNDQTQDIDCIWIQNYNIHLLDMQMSIVKQNEIIEISKKFQFFLQVQMPMFMNQYKLVYTDTEFDNSMLIKSRILPVIMNLSHLNYLSIMKVLNANISYDDLLDKYFIFQYDQKMDQDFAAIDFQLDIDKITLIFSENNIPFSQLNLQEFRIIFQKQPTKNHIELIGMELEGTYFEEIDDILYEKSLIGNLDVNEKHSTKDIMLTYGGDSEKIPDEIKYEFQNYNQNKTQDLHIKIDMENNGNKIIDISLQHFNLNIRANYLMKLSAFGGMDDSVTPPDPKIYYNQLELPEIVNNQVVQINQMTVNICIQNVLMVLQAEKITNCLAITGQIKVSIVMTPQLPYEQTLKIIKEKELSFEQSYELNQTMKLDLFLNGLQVFICDKNEIKTKNFNLVLKRNIFNPFSLFLTYKTYLQLNKDHFFINKQIININIEPSNVQVSFKNIENIQLILNRLLANMNKDNKQKEVQQQEKQTEQSENLEENLQKLVSNKKKGDILQVTENNINMKLQNICIGLINDTADAIPILDFQSNIDFEMTQNIINTQIMVKVGSKISYFNPQKSRWEPVLEQTGLEIECIQNQFVNPKFILDVEINDLDYKNINLNISTQFLNVITNGFQTFQANQQKQQFEIDDKDYDLVLKVSPYKIQNLTGYKIQVEKEFNKYQQSDDEQKLILYNKQKLNFQVETDIEDYENQILEDDLQNQYFVKFHFICDHLSSQEINKINLDRVKTKTQTINDIQNNKHHIILSVDIIDDRKVLTIASLLVFKNTTNLNIQIKFQNSNYQILNLQKDQLIPIPLDLIQEKVYLIHDDCQSQLISLSDILMNLDQNYEIKIFNKYLNIEVKKQNLAKGYTLVKINAPYIIQNCLPNKLSCQLSIKNNIISQFVLETLEIYEEFNISKKEIVQASLQFLNFKRSNGLLSQNKYFEIQDQFGNKGKINLLQDSSYFGSQKFYFYLQSYILNQTSIELNIQTQKEKNKPLTQLCGYKSNDQINIMNDDNFIILDHNDVKSKPINIQGNTHQFSEIQTEKGLLEIVLKTQLYQPNECIISDQLTLSPKFIIINHTLQTLYIRQSQTEQNIQIYINQRLPYFWFDGKIPNKNIQLSIDGPQTIQNWSGDLDINSVGEMAFVLRDQKDAFNNQFYQIDIQIQEYILYINIKESQQEKEFYIIENKTDLNIVYGQLNHQMMQLKGLQNQQFAWDQPQENKTIVVIFKLQQKDYRVEVNLNVMNFAQIVDDTQIIVQTELCGVTRKVIIEKQIQYIKKQTLQQNIQYDSVININLDKIGISLIQNYKDILSQEFLYIQMNRLELNLSSNKQKYTTQLRLGYLNIDNNSKFQTRFPVLLTPLEHKKYDKEENFFLNILLTQNLIAKSCTFYEQVVFDIDPFTLRIEDEFFNYASNFSNKAFQAMQYEQECDMKSVPEQYKWQTCEILPQVNPMYINNLILSPIEIIITLNCNFQSQDNQMSLNPIMNFLKGIGSSVINIAEANITLKGIELSNCFDSTTGITNKMFMKYKNEVMPQIFLLLGNLEIIGNPVGLFQNIGSGIQDLYKKPKEGFVKGPLEGGLGVLKGAGSLLKKTLAGSLDSVDKITGSLGSGFAHLSLDDEYMIKRQQRKAKKAKNVGQGLQQAGLTLFSGIEKGVTGLFTKPIDGIKKGGVGGFFKGTAQGLAGLIVKPVTGVLDASSKTVEGIKNQVTIGDDKPNENRERTPRNFYGPEKFYKVYNDTDADAFQILQQICNQKYQNKACFLDSQLLQQQVDEKKFLIITMDNLIFLNLKNLKLEWDIQTINIKSASIIPTGFVINVKQNSGQTKNIEIVVKDQQQKKIVFQRIEELIQIVNELK